MPEEKKYYVVYYTGGVEAGYHVKPLPIKPADEPYVINRGPLGREEAGTWISEQLDKK